MVDHAIEQDKPNGPVAAVLLAGGIGVATLGIVTTLAEASDSFAQSLAWVQAVGPLTGKALVSVIVFFIAWLVLHFIFRGKEVNFNQIFTISLVLLIIGLVGTFPPFFELFAGE
jgi:hypothetical protein